MRVVTSGEYNRLLQLVAEDVLRTQVICEDPLLDRRALQLVTPLRFRPYIATAIEVRDLSLQVAGVYGILMNDRLYYVGETACLWHRLTHHEHWIDGCEFEVLEHIGCETRPDRYKLETKHINRALSAGCSLLNNCDRVKAFYADRAINT